MLTERFDESLILLKDMWKLDFEDIVSLKAKDNSAAQIFRVEDLSKNFTVKNILYSIISSNLRSGFHSREKPPRRSSLQNCQQCS